jgi:hypothetical protein
MGVEANLQTMLATSFSQRFFLLLTSFQIRESNFTVASSERETSRAPWSQSETSLIRLTSRIPWSRSAISRILWSGSGTSHVPLFSGLACKPTLLSQTEKSRIPSWQWSFMHVLAQDWKFTHPLSASSRKVWLTIKLHVLLGLAVLLHAYRGLTVLLHAYRGITVDVTDPLVWKWNFKYPFDSE